MRRRHFLQSGGALLGSAMLPAAARTSSAAVSLPPLLNLDGGWHRSPATSAAPPAFPAGAAANATVPGCWEADGVSALDAGPFWYQTQVVLPQDAARWRWWLECDAVAEECEIWFNQQLLGRHRGVWDAFAMPLSAGRTQPGEALVSLRIRKPVGKDAVEAGLYGFLPYVWGTWGGPWQNVRLRATGPVRIAGLRSFATPLAPSPPASGPDAALLEVAVELEGDARRAVCHLRLEDAAGHEVLRARAAVRDAKAAFGLAAGDVRRWHPGRGELYRLVLEVFAAGRLSDRHERRIGFRDIRPEGERLLVNGEPVYPRAVLDWGYHPRRRIPNPSPDDMRRELEQVRCLGFNMVKFCLWVPPRHCFDVADEMGMLVWQELPLWNPASGAEFEERVRSQYARITAQRADHPSIAVWTLGCELSNRLSSQFLGTLYRLVKTATRSRLVRDNSGSSETYDGPLPEHADFWDFHFYTNLPYFRPIVEAFAPGWRKRQPWLFGEFCDADAFRDLPAVLEREGTTPWWASPDQQVNPRGVRWEMNLLDEMPRLRANSLLPHLDELRRGGLKQAELVRKVTIEEARSFPFISGYTVTGLRDTPGTSAGMFDYFDQVRFEAESFRRFNRDTVLFLQPYRSRQWEHGGDRPRFRPRWNLWAGTEVALEIGVSHFGHEGGEMRARWRLAAPEGRELARGETAPRRLQPGTAVPVGWIRCTAPRLTQAARLEAEVELFCNGRSICQNRWPLFVYPQPAAGAELLLFDPAGVWADAKQMAGWKPRRVAHPAEVAADAVVMATDFTSEWREWVRRGGRLLLAAGRFSGMETLPLPFWREALRLFPPHASWGDFPLQGWTDLQFYGLATDFAFRWPLAGEWADARVEPVLTRVDARTYEVASYVFAAHPGRGRLLATTLALAGGRGDQPRGLDSATDFENVAGSSLLRQWVDWLQRDAD